MPDKNALDDFLEQIGDDAERAMNEERQAVEEDKVRFNRGQGIIEMDPAKGDIDVSDLKIKPSK